MVASVGSRGSLKNDWYSFGRMDTCKGKKDVRDEWGRNFKISSI